MPPVRNRSCGDEDTNRCEEPSCDPPCDDGVYCNGVESCVEDECVQGTPVDCDDSLYCNGVGTCNEDSNSCDAGNAPCQEPLVCNENTNTCEEPTCDTPCDNGVYCDGLESCVEGECVQGTPVDCDDSIYCNGVGTCNEDSNSCDAGNAPCQEPLVCNEDTNTCEEPTCDPPCEDGVYCNGRDICVEGECVQGTPVDCDDSLYCNGEETCNESTNSCDAGNAPCQEPLVCNEDFDLCVGCIIDEDCDDGVYSNGEETCNETTNNCDVGDWPDCDDGLYCNGIETANDTTSTCDPGTPVTCDDSSSCTDDSCGEGNTPPYYTCTNECNASMYGDPCCEDPACADVTPCLARVIIDPGEVWAAPGSVGVKVPICLVNLEDEVGAVQLDLCESVGNCLECVGC